LVGVLTVVIVAFSTGRAFATTCNGYVYTGQEANGYYQGLEGAISVDTLSLPNTSSAHNVNWVGLTNFQTSPNYWLQVGYGYGALPSPCGAVSSLYAYEENQDVNGYNCTWETPISLAQNDYYTVFYTGTFNDENCPGADGLLDGYIYNGSSWTLIGQAWVPSCAANLTPQALAEGYTASSATCPDWNQYEYFGTNGSGTVNSGTSLDLSTNGTSWAAWTGGPAAYWNFFSTFNQISNYDAFSMYGS
jgi:hypothetical protein